MQTTRPTHEARLLRSAVFLAVFVNKMKPGGRDRMKMKICKNDVQNKSTSLCTFKSKKCNPRFFVLQNGLMKCKTMHEYEVKIPK